MTDLRLPLPSTPALPRSASIWAALALGAGVLGLALTPVADNFVARMLLFYAGTSAAYGLMPFVRRGDVPLVASWVVLLSELAPCISGELISPAKVAADGLGVVLATAPIYLARWRQIQQGDIRSPARRASERRPFPNLG